MRLELLRAAKFPHCVSRLQGLFLFESLPDALAGVHRMRLQGGPERISEIEIEPTRVSRHDSEWITFNLLNEESSEWLTQYWSGATAGARPLFEVLADGCGAVLNTELRAAAYRRVMETWPESTLLLAAAACGFACGLRELAVVTGGLIQSSNIVSGDMYVDLNQFDSAQTEIIEAMERCRAAGFSFPFKLPADGESVFRLPDLSHESFSISEAEILNEVMRAAVRPECQPSDTDPGM